MPTTQTAVDIDALGDPYPMYTQAFADDRYQGYRDMRAAFGSLAPVEIHPGVRATLVLGYRDVITILHNDRVTADPTAWMRTARIPPDFPWLPLVGPRRNALRSSGIAHARYRAATVDALTGIDHLGLEASIAERTVRLVNTFCGAGRAELIGDFLTPLIFSLINDILGCPDDIGAMIAQATAAMFDGTDSVRLEVMLSEAFGALVDLKWSEPGEDATTRFLRHRSGLSRAELFDQLLTVYAAGIEPLVNLIAEILLEMMRDSAYIGYAGRPGRPTDAAVTEILIQRPPMADFCPTYPTVPLRIVASVAPPGLPAGTAIVLPADRPVIASMAAAATDPALAGSGIRPAGSAWTLGWGTGPHRCPSPASQIAEFVTREVIDHLLDLLPDMRPDPDQPLHRRPSPFYHALAGLPVVFDPTPQFDDYDTASMLPVLQ
ncbi:cytochrome P450 [Nocardia takedensis]|uniref:cytochrome P450 n=1 Tax=Nocardia takedensis TaxID=259390 RepID=UPI003F769356